MHDRIAAYTRRRLRVAHGKFVIEKAGATRFDLREPYYIAVASTWPVFIALGLSLLAVVVGSFAALYLAVPHSVRNLRPGDFAHAFFFSLQVISTAGFGVLAPDSLYGYIIASIERVVGIAMIPLITGVLFVRLSQSRAGIEYASHAVVTGRYGTPELRVRLANCKLTMLTGAKAEMSILMKEVDALGETWRRYHPLRLVRDRLPLFGLTWTLIHVIDELSPLHGLTDDDLADLWASLVVAVHARDQRLGRDVEQIAVYAAQDILFGKHYLPALEHENGAPSFADIRLLSEVRDDEP